jgi:uncharacterized protein (TIGR03437 family)
MMAVVFASSAWAQTLPTVFVYNAAVAYQSVVAPGSLIEFGIPAAFTASHNAVQLTLEPHGSRHALTAQLASGPNSPFDLYAVVPEAMPPGPAAVTVTAGGVLVGFGSVIIASAAPSLFAAGDIGFGPAMAQNVVSGAAPSLNQLTNPALPGGWVTLWGTGLGTASTQEVTVDVA